MVLFAHGSGSSRLSPRNRFVAEVLQRAGLATPLLNLLTADEERVDERTMHLRFDIELLAGRLVGWVKHGRFGDVHLYSAKVAGSLACVLAIWILLHGTYSRIVFRVVAALCVIAAVETLLVFSTRRSVDERIGSILFRPRPEESGQRVGGGRGKGSRLPFSG